MNTTSKNHWETIYETKTSNEVSWTQEKPKTSLDIINSFELGKDAKIIDIGGGDSNLVDYLLEEGYQNITVLDISGKALERAKERLGEKAEKVSWIISEITEFKTEESYEIWHDRAAFHFLTNVEQISKYRAIVEKNADKFMILGTFSKDGPTKCSGLDIQQYDEKSMTESFENSFEKIKCITEDHITPFNTIQNFIFCSFKRKNF
jgi:SAM-dependent methyltransferase